MTPLPASRRRPPTIEVLEPRLLFSADGPAAAVLGAMSLAGGSIGGPPSAWTAAVGQDASAASTAVSGPQRSETARELVVLDARVPDADRLRADLQRRRDAGDALEILVVRADEDGLSTLGRALSAGEAYRTVQLIGHGEPGVLQLGAAVLDVSTLRTRAIEIAGWSAGLAPGADLVLWGCDSGAGPRGAALLDALGALTGADVAASSDATGGTAAGGNWRLEVTRGDVQADAPFGRVLQASYAGLLGLGTPGPADVPIAPQQQFETGSVSTAGRTVAIGASGGVAVWIDTDGGGKRIQARMLGADGSPGQTVTIVQGGSQARTSPTVAIDDRGDFVVAWVEGGDIRASYWHGGATPHAIGAQRVDLGGYASPTAAPSVAISPDGRHAVVAWSEADAGEGDGPGRRDIAVRRLTLDATGPQGWSLTDPDPLRVARNQGGRDTHPDAAIADDGSVVVVFGSTFTRDPARGGVYLATFSADGTVGGLVDFATGRRLSAPIEGSLQQQPAIAWDPATGRGLVAWVVQDSLGVRDVEAAAFDPATGRVGDAIVLATDVGAGRPSVAALATGRWVVAWQAPSGNGATAAGRDVLAIEVATDDRGAAPIGTAVRVNAATGGTNVAPSVASAGGDTTVAWSDGSRLMTRRFSADRAPTLALDPVPSPLTVAENAAGGSLQLVARLDGVPTSPDTVSWRLVGAVPAGLSIAQGRLALAGPLDFEALPPDAVSFDDGTRGWTVTVEATLADQRARTDVRIAVANVHEAPVASLAPVVTSEDVPLAFSSITGATPSLRADAMARELSVSLRVDAGSLSARAFGAAVPVASDAGASLRFTGTPDEVAAVLGSLVHVPAADRSGEYTLTLTATDGDPAGSQATTTATITVTPVDDAPVARVDPTPIPVVAGGQATIDATRLGADDVDDPVASLRWTLVSGTSVGELVLDGRALQVGDTFGQSDVAAGRLAFAARSAGAGELLLRVAGADGGASAAAVLSVSVEAPPAVPAQAVTDDAQRRGPLPASPPSSGAGTAPTVTAGASMPSRFAASAMPIEAPDARPSVLAPGLGGPYASAGPVTAVDASPMSGSAQATDIAGGASALPAPGASASAAPASALAVLRSASGTAAVPGGSVTAARPAEGAAVPAAAVREFATGAAGAAQSTSGQRAAGGYAGPTDAGQAALGPESDRPQSVDHEAASRAGGTDPAAVRRRGDRDAAPIALAPAQYASAGAQLARVEFRQALEQGREEAAAPLRANRVAVASSVAIGTSVSLGYAVWLARGSVLLTSLLASMPPWRSIDPLPVLKGTARVRDDHGEDDSLRGLLQRAAERRLRESAGPTVTGGPVTIRAESGR